MGPGPAPLNRRDPLPLWAQLVTDLRRRLAAGEFDADFPTESRLVQEYGVSRHTVREALRELRSCGILVTRRGRGSHVDHTRFEQPLSAVYSLFREVERRGIEQHSEVLRREVCTEGLAARHLGLDPETPLVVLQRRRLADGEPLAIDTAWLPLDVGTPLLDVDFGRTALYDELARYAGVRVDGGRERILPVVPAAAERRLLDVPVGTATFRVERIGRSAGRAVEYRVSLIRGDRFAFVAEWSIDGGTVEISAEPVGAPRSGLNSG